MAYFDKFNKGAYHNKTVPKKIWNFIWHDDSLESWVVNIILAFIIIKFIVYPGLGLILGTTHPIVAVVSGSMYHGLESQRIGDQETFKICGNSYSSKEYINFDKYWINCGKFYEDIGTKKSDFQKFPIHNGFSKGDIMILKKTSFEDIKIGDVVVFMGAKQHSRPDPIIHRVIAKTNNSIIQTKGDHNEGQLNGCDFSGCVYESNIEENQIIGKAFIRVPLIGYIKIWAVNLVCLVNRNLPFCIKG